MVVAQVGDGARAVAEAHRTQPDVAMLDLRMPEMDGIEATRRISEELPATRVLVLTTFGTDELVFEALAAGAAGFLLKDVRAEDLLEAVAAVARGESRLDPAVTAAVVGHFRNHQAPIHADHDLGLTPGSARSWCISPRARATPRSPRTSGCRRAPSRPTSPPSWPSWASGTGSRPSSRRTSRDWSAPDHAE